MNYSILVYKDEDNVFIAECVELAGCISQGDTKEDAINNIKDAIKGYLYSLEQHPEEKVNFTLRQTIGLIPVTV